MSKQLLKEAFSDDPAMLAVFEGQEQTALMRQLLDQKNEGTENALAPNKKRIGILKELLKLREQMLEAELISMIEPLIPPLIPAPVQGEAGKDGRDGIDGRDGTDGDDGEQGVAGQDGKDGEDGEDGMQVSAQQILDAISSLEGEEASAFGKAMGSKIDISNIRNASSFMFGKKKYKTEELLHGGGPTLVAGSGVTITANANGTTTIAATGASIASEIPVGAVNGVNTTYTVAHTPLFIIADSNFRISGQGYTYVAPTITMDPLIPPVQFIISYYAA